MRLAILSNVTVEILAGMLKKEHDVWIPPGFGAWMETALKPPAEMVGFAPEAVADAIMFLLSPAARWITGQSLVCDGGHSLG